MSSPAKRAKLPSIWLDAIPFEICVRIVSFLPLHRVEYGIHNGVRFRLFQRIPDIIPLAAASTVQERAVSASHSNLLSLEDIRGVERTSEPEQILNDQRRMHTNILIRRWIEILDLHNLREVQLSLNVPDNNDVRTLLSLPSIRKAVVPTYPTLLRALHTGGCVRSLKLLLTSHFAKESDGEEGLLTWISLLLTQCHIEHLSNICLGPLGCQSCPLLPCFVAEILESTKKRCTTLRSLHLRSTCENLERLARLPSMFPNLEEFGLSWVPYHQPAHYLRTTDPVQLNVSEDIGGIWRSLKRLEVLNCGNIGTFIPFGSILRALNSVVRVSGEDLKTLSTCPNLRSLDLVLEEGAERCFPKNLCNLSEISLIWNPDHTSLDLHLNYYEADFEVLSAVIQRNNCISKLCLRNVMIPLATLDSMLSAVGDNLRSLYIPIFHQGESPPYRFSRLASLIMRYNTRLSDIEVCPTNSSCVSELPDLGIHESGICIPFCCEFCDLRKRIDVALNVWRRRVLNLCDNSIKRLKFEL